MTCLLASGFALCMFFWGNRLSCVSTDWRNSPDLLNKVRLSVASVRFVSKTQGEGPISVIWKEPEVYGISGYHRILFPVGSY